MRKGIKILIIVLAVLIAVGVTGTLIISNLAKGLDNYLANVEITPVDLDRIEDGTYPGHIDAGIIKVSLEVDVRDHVITDIRLLEHRNGQGGPAEKIIPRIIEEQRVDVDTISGATYSSLVIQGAVCKALERL